MLVPAAADGPVALGGSVAGDPYLLPSMAAALVLAGEGFSAVNLGVDVPATSLAMEGLDARIVWVECQHCDRRTSDRAGARIPRRDGTDEVPRLGASPDSVRRRDAAPRCTWSGLCSSVDEVRSTYGRILVLIPALAVLAGCLPRVLNGPSLRAVDRGGLAPPDLALQVPGLSPCTDDSDRTLHLNSGEPVTVLVHGCYGSAGLFRALGQVLAFHGQQAVCFTYDYRDSLMVSSAELIASLDALARGTPNKRITVIGHSQGGLIARKALVEDRPVSLSAEADLRLVTVSAPLAGIAATGSCGSALAQRLSLGLIPLLCQIISGDKWYEITSASEFIRQPGRLVAQVDAYLKIVTDERGTCRRYEDGSCVEEDFVFSLAEQRFPEIDAAGRVTIVEVKAGHVEIVGDRRVVPAKLIAILQKNGILNPTPTSRSDELERLLATLY